MLGLLAAFVWAQQAPAQVAEGELTSRHIIEQAMIRYAKAKSVVGTIVMTQTALNKQATVETMFQYERPRHIFIDQKMTGAEEGHIRLVSNGAMFEYTPPTYLPGSVKMLREPMKRIDGYVLDFTDMFNAAKHSFIDRSAALELIFARRDGLEEFRNKISSHHYTGKVIVNGQPLHKVMARWREGVSVPTEDNVAIYFDEQFGIVQFVLTQRISTVTSPNPSPDKIVKVDTVWKVNAKVDEKPDYGLFTIKA